MKTPVKFPSSKEVEKATAIFKKGGVVVFPTDTVFGIGCVYDNSQAVQRIYKIKNRPRLPMPILIASKKDLANLGCQISNQAKDLIDRYWPGALTLILNCSHDKVGLRMPNYLPLLDLIRKVGKPIIGTSANFHGDDPPTKDKNLDNDFKALVDFVLPGECILKKESTVIDCTLRPIKIVRHGACKVVFNI